jgi:hypothetical protein
MLSELLRCEKEAHIIPDADIDAFMKARIILLPYFVYVNKVLALVQFSTVK